MDHDSVPLEPRPGGSGQGSYFRPAILTLLEERQHPRLELARRLQDLGFHPGLIADLCVVLRDMQSEGLIVSTRDRIGAQPERVYCLTAKGRKHLGESIPVMVHRRQALDTMLDRYRALFESPGLAPVGCQDGHDALT